MLAQTSVTNQVEVSKQLPSAIARHGFNMHFVFSRNCARADIRFFGLPQPSRHLAHCAHYVDRLPMGNSLHDFNMQRYLSAADAVGAWG